MVNIHENSLFSPSPIKFMRILNKDFLMSRNFNAKIIDNATDRARLIPLREALKKIEKKPTNRTVFCLAFHPALPDINKKVLSRSRF